MPSGSICFYKIGRQLLAQNRSATRHIPQITAFTKHYKQKHDVNKKMMLREATLCGC